GGAQRRHPARRRDPPGRPRQRGYPGRARPRAGQGEGRADGDAAGAQPQRRHAVHRGDSACGGGVGVRKLRPHLPFGHLPPQAGEEGRQVRDTPPRHATPSPARGGRCPQRGRMGATPPQSRGRPLAKPGQHAARRGAPPRPVRQYPVRLPGRNPALRLPPMPSESMRNIRNFSIIAHVDHGKSTLADRIIQLCGGLTAREMEAQVLDNNPIERERGITIKAQSVSVPYTARNGETYHLNFIDTPGHVDFSYEVSRSLAACEGALLVVDAAQGVEAQSVANCYTAVEQGLEVVPVLNKIDLPTADIERAKAEIEAVIGIDASDAVAVSAKTGLNVEEVLEAIVH